MTTDYTELKKLAKLEPNGRIGVPCSLVLSLLAELDTLRAAASAPRAELTDERAAFEKFATAKFLATGMWGCGTQYTDTWTQKSWEAWQARAVLAQAAPVADECDECKGTGQVAYETSGLAEDGNAPVVEPCPMCAYGATAAPVAVPSFSSAGRYCMSEDRCIAEGIDFASYEQGVLDAIHACERIAKRRAAPAAPVAAAVPAGAPRQRFEEWAKDSPTPYDLRESKYIGNGVRTYLQDRTEWAFIAYCGALGLPAAPAPVDGDAA